MNNWYTELKVQNKLGICYLNINYSKTIEFQMIVSFKLKYSFDLNCTIIYVIIWNYINRFFF